MKHSGQFKRNHIPWNKGLKGVRYGGHNGLDRDKNPNWRGGKGITSQGYTWLNIGKSKRILEHRFVMEQYLGRKLKTNEQVHHKNYIKTDNRIENLELITPQEHGKKSASRRWRLQGAMQ